MAQPDELIARLSRDKRLDAFNKENLEHLFPEFLWSLIEAAEKEVLVDTRARLKEQQLTLAKDTRAVNAPDDMIVIHDLRYRTSSDDALVEGIPIEIVPETDLL